MASPIFLLAPPRSFTTVVTAMLGNHSKMFGLAETNLFSGDRVSDLFRLYSRAERLSHGLLRSMAQLAFGSQSEEDVAEVRSWLEKNQDMLTAEIFDGLREWGGDCALLEKSPMHVININHLKRIGDTIEDARFIHMVRHPLKVYDSAKTLRNSIQKAGLNQSISGDLTPEVAWLKPHMTILEFLLTIPHDRQIRIKGEDLMSDPTLYLPQICSWLEIDTTDDDIEAMLHPEQSPFAAIGPSNAPLGNDPSFMRNPELRPYEDNAPDVTTVNEEEHGVSLSRDIQHHAQIFGY